MEGDFETRGDGAVVCQYAPWLQSGLVHGFVGRDQDAGAENRDAVTALPGVKEVVLLDQVHGGTLLDLDSAARLDDFVRAARRGLPYPDAFKADAVLLDRLALAHAAGLAVCVRTADCLPMLISAGTHAALVHAGWRGLAAGILSKVLFRLAEVEPNSDLTVVIGPAACGNCYEVSADVVAAIGEDAVFRETGGGKYFFSLEGTAKKMICREAGSLCQVVSMSICTMTDVRFHSYRREGPGYGRNLSFMVL